MFRISTAIYAHCFSSRSEITYPKVSGKSLMFVGFCYTFDTGNKKNNDFILYICVWVSQI